MRVIEVICVLFFLSFISEASQDTSLVSLLNRVSSEAIWKNVDTLTTFERFTKESDAIEATHFLQTLLEEYQYDLVETQTYQQGYIPNIYALKRGTVYPDEYLLIGAHYDVYTAGADGADDNGSGTGALMEIARVLSTYRFEKSIYLVFYSGEEIGLLGSKHFADSAVNNNITLESIINLDVIGYLKAGTALAFDCSYNVQSQYLYDTLNALCKSYLPEVDIVEANNKTFWQSSDHRSFWDHNIPGLFFAEELDRYSSDFNSNWHTDNDIMGVSCNSRELMGVISKAAILLTANSATIADESPVPESLQKLSPKTLSHVQLSDQRLSFQSSQKSNATFTLYSLQGKELLHDTFKVQRGSNNIPLQHSFGSGVYLCTYAINGVEERIRLRIE